MVDLKRRESLDRAMVGLAASDMPQPEKLPPRLWEALRQKLQAFYRRATGETNAVLLLASDHQAALAATEAENARLREALTLALEYWAHRQQRYKNRHPAWVQAARAALSEGEAKR